MRFLWVNLFCYLRKGWVIRQKLAQNCQRSICISSKIISDLLLWRAWRTVQFMAKIKTTLKQFSQSFVEICASGKKISYIWLCPSGLSVTLRPWSSVNLAGPGRASCTAVQLKGGRSREAGWQSPLPDKAFKARAKGGEWALGAGSLLKKLSLDTMIQWTEIGNCVR